MADENKDSVLAEQPAQKSNGASLQISSIALILGVVALGLALLTAFLAQFVTNFDVIRIFNCICYVVYIAAVAVYLLDAIKFKNLALNATLLVILITTIVIF